MDHSQGSLPGSFKFAEHIRDIAALVSVRDRRVHFLNSAAEQVLGLDRAAVMADPSLLLKLVVPEDLPAVTAFMSQAEGEGSAQAEFRIRRRDGEERWLSARAFPVEGADETLRAVICEDLTANRRCETALTESDTRFRQFVENIEDAMWLASPDGTRIQYVSPAYEKVWGRPADELYAAPFKWMQAVHREDQARVMEATTFRQTEGPLELRFRIQRTEDDVRYIRHRSIPLRDSTGRITQVLCVNTDVTDQTKLESQADESARAQRDALVREVHHRIKNNLQGVTGMLRNYANLHPEVAPVINQAIAQVQAVAIIYGLQGKPGAVRVMLNDVLKEVVSGVGQLMHRTIKLENEEMRFNCKVVVSEVEAVPVALVLNEMIFNAAKHSDADAELSIDLKINIAKERATLIVTNPGKLRARTPRTSVSGGSGLQLIRSLLPRRGAFFDLVDGEDGVMARLSLEPPVVTLKC